MTVEMCAEIRIGELVLYSPQQVTIEKSWEFLSDTATISFARGLFRNADSGSYQNTQLANTIKVGSPVLIKLGYDFNFETEFEGFVTSISPETPTVIKCEDAAWRLRQTNHTASWSKISLNELLAYLLSPLGITFQTAGDINLGKFLVKQSSAYKILSELKEQYGIYSFFKAGQLFAGFPYQSTPKRIVLDYANNIDPTSRNSLSYQNEDERKIKLKGSSAQTKGGKPITWETGDEDGELRTLNLSVNLTLAEVKQFTEEKLKLYRRNGYKGEVTTFGLPFVEHSDIVEIVDNDYPERNGACRVDKVSVSWGGSGYRRTLSLGQAAI